MTKSPWRVFWGAVDRPATEQEIDVDVKPDTRAVLGVPMRMTASDLHLFIEGLKVRRDEDFPRGKWATIQHLQSQCGRRSADQQ